MTERESWIAALAAKQAEVDMVYDARTKEIALFKRQFDALLQANEDLERRLNGATEVLRLREAVLQLQAERDAYKRMPE